MSIKHYIKLSRVLFILNLPKSRESQIKRPPRSLVSGSFFFINTPSPASPPNVANQFHFLFQLLKYPSTIFNFTTMSSTYTLPTSHSQSAAGATSSLLPTSFANPAFRAFLTRLSDSVQCAFSRSRPWHELADKNSFSRPDSISDATSRIRKNFSYFRINYLSVLASVLAFSVLSHPFYLLTLFSLLSAWLFLYLFRPSDHPVVLFGRTYSDRETLGVLIVLTVIVIFLTNIGSLLMSATLVGLAVIFVHGASRVPEDLFLDDQEIAGSGMLSILSGAASSSAVAAAMPTATMV